MRSRVPARLPVPRPALPAARVVDDRAPRSAPSPGSARSANRAGPTAADRTPAPARPPTGRRAPPARARRRDGPSGAWASTESYPRRSTRRSRTFVRCRRLHCRAWPAAPSATPSSRRSATSSRGLRLLTDEADRESYRRDETAYLPTGLPGAVALPDRDGPGRRARPALRRVRRPDRAARRGLGPERRRGRHRRRADDRLHRDGPDPRDRRRQPVRRHPARRHQRPAEGRRRRARACSTRRTRRASRCARSAATWARTPAACAA